MALARPYPVPRAAPPRLSLPQIVAMDAGMAPAVVAAVEYRLLTCATMAPAVIAAVATRSSSGLPQIARLLRTKSARGMQSSRVYYGDALVYQSRAVYHLRRGYPVACWSELLVLTAQNLACFALCRAFKADSQHRARARLRNTAALDAVFLGSAIAALFALPARLLPALCLWTVPLSLASYGLQVARGGGSPTRATSASSGLRLAGSLMRIGTTAVFLGADRVVLTNHLIGVTRSDHLRSPALTIDTRETRAVPTSV